MNGPLPRESAAPDVRAGGAIALAAPCRAIVLASIVAVFLSPLASAQTLTTGSLVGVVMDTQQAVVPGASILVVQEPTGEQRVATTDDAGRFRLLNVRVGGPFAITATLAGFADRIQRDVFVALGEERAVVLVMSPATVVVTVDVAALSALDRRGPAPPRTYGLRL